MSPGLACQMPQLSVFKAKPRRLGMPGIGNESQQQSDANTSLRGWSKDTSIQLQEKHSLKTRGKTRRNRTPRGGQPRSHRSLICGRSQQKESLEVSVSSASRSDIYSTL